MAGLSAFAKGKIAKASKELFAGDPEMRPVSVTITVTSVGVDDRGVPCARMSLAFDNPDGASLFSLVDTIEVQEGGKVTVANIERCFDVGVG